MTSSLQWRKRRRRRRKPINPAYLFTFLGLLFLLGVFEESAQSPRGAQMIRTVPESFSFVGYTSPVTKESIGNRVTYPYSVVRGGVHSRDDLLREIKQDPVVAAHYSGFNAYGSQIVRVKDDKRVHVSYRINDKVYWTARKITLARGEALISDGQNLARVRCGNRVSVTPQDPTSSDEPLPEVFETPTVTVDTDLVLSATIPDEPAQLIGDIRNPITLNPPDLLTLENGFINPEVWPIIPPVTPVTPTLFTEPALPEVPEPGTLLLVASALAMHFLFRRSFFRR